MRDLTSREKRLLLMFADSLAIAGCYLLAFYLKFEFPLPHQEARLFQNTIILAIGTKLAAYYFSGCYKGVWRYASMADLLVIIRATCIATVLIIMAVIILYGRTDCPAPVFIVDWLLTIFAVGAVRFLARGYRLIVSEQPKASRKVLVVGDGDPAEMLTREGCEKFYGGLGCAAYKVTPEMKGYLSAKEISNMEDEYDDCMEDIEELCEDLPEDF